MAAPGSGGHRLLKHLIRPEACLPGESIEMGTQQGRYVRCRLKDSSDGFPESITLSDHTVPHRINLAQCPKTAFTEFSHHLLCQRAMTVSIEGDMPLEVPSQNRRVELMEPQLIEQSAEQVGNKELTPVAESRSQEVRLAGVDQTLR
jgi:hypothetical protein